MILGYIAPHLIKENIGLLIQCDMSKEMLAMSKEVPDIEVCPLIQHWAISEYFTHKYLSLYVRSWAAEFYPKSEHVIMSEQDSTSTFDESPKINQISELERR